VQKIVLPNASVDRLLPLLLNLEVSDSNVGREDDYSYDLTIFLRFSSQVLE